MDSLITAAARALAAGDVLGALKHVALRDDPSALALRGIAMARLGEYPRARELLRRAVRSFGPKEALARARCVVAEAEVALAMRELGGSPHALATASTVLEAHADHANALYAQLIAARRLLLLGRLAEADALLARLDADGMPPSLVAVAELTGAELALRALRNDTAQVKLANAHKAAERSGVQAILTEVAEMKGLLHRPAARCLNADTERILPLEEVSALLSSDMLVIDACRRRVGSGAGWKSFSRRPILFALAETLGRAWPDDADRETLITHAFRTQYSDETHRVRLRVEIGRLRALVKPWASIAATERGFILKPNDGRSVTVLVPPIDGDQASLIALLADGSAWSTSALALALNASQRTIQRALAELEANGRVRSIGQARARRWLSAPLTGFTTILLLPATLPIG